MNAEEQYYYNRSSQEVLYAERVYESQMYNLITEGHYIIMKSVGAKLYKDGNQWCCLYGENLQVGIAGFGETPHKAVLDFNKAFDNN